MIPTFNLSRQWQKIKKEVLKEVYEKVLLDTSYCLGPAVKEFEKKFAEWNGSKYAIGVSSGSDALILAIRALDLPTSTEVLVPTQTYIATIFAIIHNGLIPVFVDSDPYYGIDIKDAEKKITSNTMAVAAVHLYGQPADIIGLMDLSQRYNLKVIEDCAQAHGAKYSNRKVGNYFDIGCFSCYPGKNLGCLGDGGIVVTNNKVLAEKVKTLRNDGREEGKKYEHAMIGYNARLDSIQAAALTVKLKYLDKWNKRREEIAVMYLIRLYDVEGIILPEVRLGCTHVWHQFVIRVKDREEVMKRLKEKGVSTGIHYLIPCHLQECLKEYNKNDCPKAEQYAKEVISLPMFPEMTYNEVRTVIKKLKEVIK